MIGQSRLSAVTGTATTPHSFRTEQPRSTKAIPTHHFAKPPNPIRSAIPSQSVDLFSAPSRLAFLSSQPSSPWPPDPSHRYLCTRLQKSSPPLPATSAVGVGRRSASIPAVSPTGLTANELKCLGSGSRVRRNGARPTVGWSVWLHRVLPKPRRYLSSSAR